ncbi:MAG: internal scaffolding protein [Arizlama microvirus]|nr:MAG: internal scaffolding protein [Arizlama microvirus]
MLKIKTNYHQDKVSGLNCSEPCITQQHLKDETNINSIMARAQRTGNITSIGQRTSGPSYGDFTRITSFQEAHDMVMSARDSFMEFPASIRKIFKNDPGEMLAFLENPANKDEAIKMGLIEVPTVIPEKPTEKEAKAQSAT